MLVLLAAETDVFDASRGSVIVELALLPGVLLIVALPQSANPGIYWLDSSNVTYQTSYYKLLKYPGTTCHYDEQRPALGRNARITQEQGMRKAGKEGCMYLLGTRRHFAT